jgi:hypothetical protein
LQRLWENPAQRYSMTRRERTVARAAMVVAIMVGLSAIGAVAYYGLSALTAK